MSSDFFGKSLTETEKLEKELSKLRNKQGDIIHDYHDQQMLEDLPGKKDPAKLQRYSEEIDAIQKEIIAILVKINALKPKVYRAINEEEAVNGRNLKEEYERVNDEFQQQLNSEKTKNDPHSIKLLRGERTGSPKLEKLRLKREECRARIYHAKKAKSKTGGSRKTSYVKKSKRATRKSKIDL